MDKDLPTLDEAWGIMERLTLEEQAEIDAKGEREQEQARRHYLEVEQLENKRVQRRREAILQSWLYWRQQVKQQYGAITATIDTVAAMLTALERGAK